MPLVFVLSFSDAFGRERGGRTRGLDYANRTNAHQKYQKANAGPVLPFSFSFFIFDYEYLMRLYLDAIFKGCGRQANTL